MRVHLYTLGVAYFSSIEYIFQFAYCSYQNLECSPNQSLTLLLGMLSSFGRWWVPAKETLMLMLVSELSVLMCNRKYLYQQCPFIYNSIFHQLMDRWLPT